MEKVSIPSQTPRFLLDNSAIPVLMPLQLRKGPHEDHVRRGHTSTPETEKEEDPRMSSLLLDAIQHGFDYSMYEVHLLSRMWR